MTIKTITKRSSELALASIRDDVSSTEKKTAATLSSSVLDAWTSLPDEVRAALVSSEIASSNGSTAVSSTSVSSINSESDDSSEDSKSVSLKEFHEECPATGAKMVMKPLERAPENVFEFTKSMVTETVDVKKSSSATVTTKTTVASNCRGWRNVFNLPISYDVNMVAHGTLLDPMNPQLLEATGAHAEGYNRRFAVIDEEVDRIYGQKIRAYFAAKGIELSTSILPGGEADKRSAAVDKLLDDLCVYKLRRREPFLAIGGGVLLDIAGMAACLYRRGVPFVRVPTTLLAIVDASVGVKNGVDYCCGVTDETYKNRVGSFYAPSSCLLDNSFIATQDQRNISNGIGEIMKLALVRSTDLFDLLETHGAALVESRFAKTPCVPDGVSDRIIDLSIQIMLEELGPNLWESKLDRCVDYGKYFRYNSVKSGISRFMEIVLNTGVLYFESKPL
jgi:3-dehydroquinate synthetase